MSTEPAEGALVQWEQLCTLFDAAMTVAPAARFAFLDARCGHDTLLRDQVISLTAARDGAPEYLAHFYADVLGPAFDAALSDAGDDTSHPSQSDLLPDAPISQIRHFHVLERIGRGGTGIVYRGRDTLLDRDVAIKFLSPALVADPAARARLVREAQAASQLDDLNVCATHAVETAPDGSVCIVMAYCGGGTLRDRLRHGPIPIEEIESIARGLASGMASAHRAGIIHGDIKPANVGFGDRGVVKLLDFGVAVRARDEAGAGRRELSGTLPYLAPEALHGEPRDAQADVWALGVTLFELVTERRPFHGDEFETLASAIETAPLPSLSRRSGEVIPARLAKAIAAMLDRTRDRRPTDGDAVLALLDTRDMVNGIDARPVAGSAAHPSPMLTAGASRVMRVAGVTLVTALLALLGWRLRAADSPTTALPPAPLEVARTETPISTIAVLPFSVRGGAELRYLADGMVDLLTPAFDGTGLVRGVDPNAVIGAMRQRRGATLDSATARALAAVVRADRYVVGSVVGTGTSLMIRATLSDNSGREVGRAQAVVADRRDLIAGAESLVRQLIASELRAPGDTLAGIAAATTRSAPALRAYLDGERELRDARPRNAVASFQRAVTIDTTFALAWYRLARAARWSDVDSLSRAAAARASLHADDLPLRLQSLVRGYRTLRSGGPLEAERQFQQIVTDYPTDVEGWMLLGEAQFLNNPYYGRSSDEAAVAFRRVMALDPRNREVTVYLMDLAARTARIGQLDTLFTMYFSPNSAGEQPGIRATYLALHARRRDTAEPARHAAQIEDPVLARVALSRIGPMPVDRAAAYSFARTVAAQGATSRTRAEGQQALAILAVADGHWAEAARWWAIAVAGDADAVLESRALSALAPSVQVSLDTLRRIRSELESRTATRGEARTSDDTAVRVYLLGLLNVRLDDTSGVAAARAWLRRRREEREPLTAPLEQSIAAHWQLRHGQADAALASFEKSVPEIPADFRARHPVLGQHLDRLERARLLLRRGRIDDARRWARSLLDGAALTGAPFAAAADSVVRGDIGRFPR